MIKKINLKLKQIKKLTGNYNTNEIDNWKIKFEGVKKNRRLKISII